MPAGLTQEWTIVRAKAGGDFWFDWRDGKAQRLVARLLAPQLKASYAARKPVEINDLGMNLFFDREAQGWKVRVGDLAANFGEQRWGEVELLLRRDQQNNEPHWKLQADRVDLTPLVPAIEALAPLPDAAAEWVAGLKPKGILHNLNADFWPQREVPERVSYATNLEKVGISAFHEVPAVENVSGTLTGTWPEASSTHRRRISCCTWPRYFPSRGATARLARGCSGAWTTAPSPSVAT